MGAFLAALPSIVQGAAGLGQMIFSGRKKAGRELDQLQYQSPQYGGSKPISDYYQTALERYKVNPTDSAMYRRQAQNAMRATAGGLSALKGRGGALAGVNKLVAGQGDAMLKAEMAAEQEQSRRFGEYGRATGMKAQDDMAQFNINKMMPFQRKDRLAQMKLGAANARFDAGAMNLFGGGANAATILGKK